jgi:guanylate kinase
MSENPNTVRLFLPLEIRLLLNKECAENDQLPATVILRILAEHYKDKLPQDVYEYLIYQYSLTALQQRERKRQNEKQPKQDARERKLRDEIAMCDLRLKDTNTANNPDQWRHHWEGRKKRAEESLKIHLETRVKP